MELKIEQIDEKTFELKACNLHELEIKAWDSSCELRIDIEKEKELKRKLYEELRTYFDEHESHHLALSLMSVIEIFAARRLLRNDVGDYKFIVDCITTRFEVVERFID